MSRIRTIKPEFWTNTKVMECKPVTRLLFIGMWNFADDYGRMPFAPKTIRAQVLPGDDFTIADVRDMLLELSVNGLIMIYSVEDREYLEITGWDHQKISNRADPKCPAPFVQRATEDCAELQTNLSLSDPKGREGKGKEWNDSRVEDALAQFWGIYPRKVGKAAAKRQLRRVLNAGVPLESILAGVQRYSDKSRTTDVQFIKHPATWLNAGCWEDEDTPAKPSVVATKISLDDAIQQWIKFSRWSPYAPVNDVTDCPPELLAKHGLAPDGRKLTGARG